MQSNDQHARRIEQLERDAFEARRTIEKLKARLERLEASFGCPRPAREPVRPYSLDPLGR